MWTLIWIVAVLFAIVIEIVTVELVGIWFIPGAVIAAILALCGVHWAIQVGVFVASTILFIILFRKRLLKKLNSKENKTNTDLIIGKELQLISGIGFQQAGSVKINGVIWSVSLEDETASLEAGAFVTVVNIKGNKLIVREVK